MPAVVELKNIGKSFILPHEKRDTLKENVLHFLKKRTYEHFMALDNVTLKLGKGEFLGIIGKNGSGKSTLLKIIAGIYKPDKGVIDVNGNIAPFLELGIGFQPELTARENIMVNATLLGLTRKEIIQKFSSIVEFAEIGHFLDLKMKNFSSGMQARLAFAIAREADADLYLCDEVLAVGDEAFQQKCLEVFRNWKSQGKTMILVSHNASLITQFCTRAMLLEQGKLICSGDPETVVDEYHRRLQVQSTKESPAPDFSNSDVRITDVRFFNKGDEEKDNFRTGETMVIRIFYKAIKPVEKPVFGIAIHSDEGVHMSGPNTKTSDYTITKVEGEGYLDCVISPINLLGGKYFLTVSCFDYSCAYPYDYADKKYSFTIEKNRANQFGLIELPVTWRFHD